MKGACLSQFVLCILWFVFVNVFLYVLIKMQVLILNRLSTALLAVVHNWSIFQNLRVYLKKKTNTYSKKSLIQILLCGEKPQLPNKFIHNKFIFLSVQYFICKTKRLFSRNWLHCSMVKCLLTCHNNLELDNRSFFLRRLYPPFA